jgi:Ca2+-binding RTX toxin-like protein
MTTNNPAVPTVVVTRAGTQPIGRTINTTYASRLNSGDPLAWGANSLAFGTSTTVHHVIPVGVAQNFEALFNDINKYTATASTGPLAYNVNSAGNLLALPNTVAAMQSANQGPNGIFAAVHIGNHPDAYTDLLRDKLTGIRKTFVDEVDAAGTIAAKEAAAMRAFAKVQSLTNTVTLDLQDTRTGNLILNWADPRLPPGFANLSSDAKKNHFTQNGFFQQLPDYDGSILTQRAPDGNVVQHFTSAEAQRSFFAGTSQDTSFNGMNRHDLARDYSQRVGQQLSASELASRMNDSTFSANVFRHSNDLSNTLGTASGLRSSEIALARDISSSTARRIEIDQQVQRIQSSPSFRKFGIAGSAVGLLLLAGSVQAAHAQGDTQKVKDLITEFGKDEIASAIATAGAVALATVAVAAVGVTAPIAAGIVVVAGLLGGAFGSDTVKSIMDAGIEALRGIDMAEVRSIVRGLSGGILPNYNFTSTVPIAARNPTMLDVVTDTERLNPRNTSNLGQISDGQAAVDSSGAHVVNMPARDVDFDGFQNTSGSAIAANQTRPGAGTTSQTRAITNELRVQGNALQPTPVQMETVAMPTGLVDARVEIITLTPTATDSAGVLHRGVAFFAEVFKAEDGTSLAYRPTANASLEVRTSTGVIIRSGTLSGGQFYAHSRVASSGTNFLGNPEPIDLAATVLQIRRTALVNPKTDPLIIDTDSNGVSVLNAANSVGTTQERVARFIPPDGMLVRDVNEDGAIDLLRESFSLNGANNTLRFSALDSNGDLKIDQLDLAFFQLEIWTDKNVDGYASLGERQSAIAASLVSININPAQYRTSTVAGFPNVRGLVATYSDDTTRTIWDVPTPHQSTVTTSVTEFVPGVNRHTDGTQASLIATTFQGSVINLSGTDATIAIGNLGNDFLQGSSADDWLLGGAGADRFMAGDGRDTLIIDADDLNANIDAGSGIDTVVIADDRTVVFNLALSNVEVVYGGYGNDVLIAGGNDNVFIDGAAGNDFIVGSTVDDALAGEDGDDTIDGGLGDDLIRGHRGVDRLFGGAGNDVLDGGDGNDSLDGGTGNDVIRGSAGRDFNDGGDGFDILLLRGQLEDYRFFLNEDGRLVVADTLNLNESKVELLSGSSRDGVQELLNIERIGAQLGSGALAIDLASSRPIAVNDVVSVGLGNTPIAISTAQLLANDLDFQNLGSSADISVYWVGDAVGGSVALSGSSIVFTPNASFTGPLEFAYKLRDAAGNVGPLLVPANDVNAVGATELRGLVRLTRTTAPSDPGYANQWYLGVTRVNEAWAHGATGAAVNVLVYEPSGPFAFEQRTADLSHPDLVANRSSMHVSTAETSSHATAVAGIIGAARNSIGTVGVAFNSKLTSIGMNPFPTVNGATSEFASMLRFDVVNNSWGRADPWSNAYDSMQRVDDGITAQGVANAASVGRNGLGTVLVNGAGNGRNEGRDAGLSALTANDYSITVGAITRPKDNGTGVGVAAPFTNRGAVVLVSAPGSDLLTTDSVITTALGSSIGAQTQDFSGTSGATPIVSGIAALMLEANPKLTYRDVQHILALTARKPQSSELQLNTQWANNAYRGWNGVGMHFSHDLGFGMVDAGAAVRMASNWSVGTNRTERIDVTSAANAAPLPDVGTALIGFDVGSQLNVEHVQIELNVSHARWSDLEITLVSPNGTRSVLLDRVGFANGQIHFTNPADETVLNTNLMSTHFRGENATGRWNLEVTDRVSGASADSAITASLRITGASADSLQRYVLTDEYVGGKVLTPVVGRENELNASALRERLVLDLSASGINGSVGTRALTVAPGFYRIVGSAVGDSIKGTAANERLLGAEGDDTIEGRAGYDFLIGGRGSDSLDGGADSDVLIAGHGSDLLTGGLGGDIFWVQAGHAATTTVADFNLGQGDLLNIARGTKLLFTDLTQVIRTNGLEISFADSSDAGSTRSIIRLTGVYQTLTQWQLQLESSEKLLDDLIINPLTGSYYPHGSILIRPTPQYMRQPYFDAAVNQEVVIGFNYPTGTDNNDYMIAADVQRMPSNVNPDSWNSRLASRSPRRFQGGKGDDQLIGNHENEILEGGLGSDRLDGGGGNDTLRGDAEFGTVPIGQDFSSPNVFEFRAGSGNDKILDFDRNLDILNFTNPGAVSVLRTNVNSTVLGIGVDFLISYGVNDSVSFSSFYSMEELAQSANGFSIQNSQVGTQNFPLFSPTPTENDDLLLVSSSSETLNALGGNDVIYALSTSAQTIHAGTGDDKLYIQSGGKLLDGGDGNDYIELVGGLTGQSHNTLRGGFGDDKIIGSDSGETIFGDFGNDVLSGLGGNDVIEGGSGQDSLSGQDGSDILRGGLDNDYLSGGSGNDFLYGDDADDNLFGSLGNDRLEGANGNDFIGGGDGNDELIGGNGSDSLYGGAGTNRMEGGAGNDSLIGEAGDDTLIGGAGDDFILTGSGIDVVEFDSASGNDFVSGLSGVDKLRFVGLNAGFNSANLTLQILADGSAIAIGYGSNQLLTLDRYSLTTRLEFADDAETERPKTLNDLFNDKNLFPDMSFNYLAAFDTQLTGTWGVRTVEGTSADEELYGGPLTTANPEWVNYPSNYDASVGIVLGRGGDDSLAVGLLGGVLDGGTGTNKLLAGRNVFIQARGIQQGHNTLFMPAGVLPEHLTYTRVRDPLTDSSSHFDFGRSRLNGPYIGGLPDGVELDRTLDPYRDLLSGGTFAQNGNFDTLRIRSRNGEIDTYIVDYFDSEDYQPHGGNRSNLADVSIDSVVFTTAFDEQGRSVVRDINDEFERSAPAAYKPSSILAFSPGYRTSDPFLRLERFHQGTEGSDVLQGRVAWTVDAITAQASYFNHLTINGYSEINVGSASSSYSRIAATTTPVVVSNLPEVIMGFGGDDFIFAGYRPGVGIFSNSSAYSISLGSNNIQSQFGIQPLSAQRTTSVLADSNFLGGLNWAHARYYGPQFGTTFGHGGAMYDELPYNYFGDGTLLVNDRSEVVESYDHANGGDGNDRYLLERGSALLFVFNDLSDPKLGASGFDQLLMPSHTLEEVEFQIIDYRLPSSRPREFSDNSDLHFIVRYKLGGPTTDELVRIALPRWSNQDGGIDLSNLQIEEIVFSNSTVSLRPLIETLLNQRGYAQIFANTFAQKPTDFTISNDMLHVDQLASLPSSAVVYGTLQADTIEVSRTGQIVNGLEGYDTIYSIGSSFYVEVAGEGSILAIPTAEQRRDLNYYDPRVGLGYLRYRDDGVYSAADWVAVDANNDLGNSYFDGNRVVLDVRNGWGPSALETVARPHLYYSGTSNVDVYGSQGADSMFNNSLMYGLGGDDLLDREVIDNLFYRNAEGVLFLHDPSNDNLYGGGGNDVLRGGSGDDILDGGAGNDEIFGGSGDDRLIGNSGADVLHGGIGNDTYEVDQFDTVVEIADQAGTQSSDTIVSVADINLESAGFANIENATATGGANQLIEGNSSANILTGSGNGTRLVGRNGNDVYVVASNKDQIVEGLQGGLDELQTSVNQYGLSANVENLVSNGSSLVLVGNNLDNLIVGDDGANYLDGLGGIDVLVGGRGDDTYVVNSPFDKISESFNDYSWGENYHLAHGNDTVRVFGSYSLTDDLATQAIEVMRAASDDAVILAGNFISNTLIGSDGNDFLDGRGGVDIAEGGAGDDIYRIDQVSDTVIESPNNGRDTLLVNISNGNPTPLVLDLNQFNNFEDLTIEGAGRFDLIGNAAGNTLVGNASSNRIIGNAGNDRLDGAGGVDQLEGGAGDDIYVVRSQYDTVNEVAFNGADLIELHISERYELQVNVENLVRVSTANTINIGNELENNILGGSGNDRIEGLGGNDRINGGEGSDILIGGDGNDIYIVNNNDDQIIEQDQLSVPFAGTEDTVLISHVEAFTLPAHVERGVRETPGELTGNALPNTLTGSAGADVLFGGDGDILIGGSGDDQYFLTGYFSASGDGSSQIVEVIGGGIDTIYSAFEARIGNGIENSVALGVDNLRLFGDDGPNILQGNAGNNRLYGMLGADTLIGKAGHDWYQVDTTDDKVLELDNNGIDTIELVTPMSYELPANVENLVASIDPSAATLTGNVLANLIKGNGGTNIINGGLGADEMHGKGGNDIFYIDNLGDQVVEYADSSTDHIFSSIDISKLANNVEHGTLIGSARLLMGNDQNNYLWGNALNNTLDGGLGNDYLDGGEGADRLVGGSGDDSYLVVDLLDTLVETSNQGSDTIVTTLSNFELAVNFENLIFAGLNNANFVGIGNAAANRLEGAGGNDSLTGGDGNDKLYGNQGNDSLLGGLGDDVLYGNSGDDHLLGSLGDDVLDGGIGQDQMTGGLGNDRYVVNSLSDVVTEQFGEGVDIVEVAAELGAGFTLYGNVENLVFSPYLSGIVNGNGNALANVITGNYGNNTLRGFAGNDVLDGREGADTMIGGSGDDRYYLDDRRDSVQELSGEGNDWIFYSANGEFDLSIAPFVENLQLNGFYSTSGTGNSLANIIVGTSAANVLDGAGGLDTLRGGRGDDVYIYNDADIIEESAGEGIDLLMSSLSVVSLMANVEDIELTGLSTLSATGNSLNNRLLGNSAANVLNGVGGNDVLSGYGGVDVYRFSGAFGQDVVYDVGGANANATPEVNRIQIIGSAGDFKVTHVGELLRISPLNTSTPSSGSIDLNWSWQTPNTQMFQVEFTDANWNVNTVWNSSALNSRFVIDTSTSGDDQIFGSINSDVSLQGLAGNDKINGWHGNDIIDGGTGNDILAGGAGADIYVVSGANQGHDVVNADPLDTLRINGFALSQLVFQRVVIPTIEHYQDYVSRGHLRETYEVWHYGDSEAVLTNEIAFHHSDWFVGDGTGLRISDIANSTSVLIPNMFNSNGTIADGVSTIIIGTGPSQVVLSISQIQQLVNFQGAVSAAIGSEHLEVQPAESAASFSTNRTTVDLAENENTEFEQSTVVGSVNAPVELLGPRLDLLLQAMSSFTPKKNADLSAELGYGYQSNLNSSLIVSPLL